MDDAPLVLTRHKLPVDDYFRMVEAGILGKDDHVELIDGEIIDMAPIGQGHESLVSGLNQALVMACFGRAIVAPQNSLRLDGLNAPQPDFAVLRPRPDFYATGNRPGPADVLLLVEVADSSLRYDRTVKLPLYAQAGIAEYWIVDVKRRAIDIHRHPAAATYTDLQTRHAGDQVALALAPDITVKFDLVFP